MKGDEGMYCLWNGEYGEHDLSYVGGLMDILERQKEQYEKDIGVVVGDYTCLEVEYDWGRRDQRWKCKCNKCGDIVYQYHVQDWRRGKGKRTFCNKCKLEEQKQEQKRESENKRSAFKDKIDAVKGTIYENWKIIDYSGFVNCKVECTVCGARRKEVRLDDITNKRLAPCSHRIPNDYSDPKWVGIRIGHLVSVRRGEGDRFVLMCDCGRERTVRSTAFFAKRSYSDCGNEDCIYANERVREARKRKKKGFDYEDEVVDLLARSGYQAERKGEGGDYGVDIICTGNDGEKIAVQCKSDEGRVVGVNAIQQVYAGGRYFGIGRFAVVAKNGFSDRAVRMAHVLGVYLSDGKTFDYPKDVGEYATKLLPVYEPNKLLKHYYELNGERKTLADWCVEYDTNMRKVKEAMANGMSLENALLYHKPAKNKKIYTVDGFTGTIAEIGEKYGVLPATISYRMKHRGMTIDEAVAVKTLNDEKKMKSISGTSKKKN